MPTYTFKEIIDFMYKGISLTELFALYDTVKEDEKYYTSEEYLHILFWIKHSIDTLRKIKG